MMPNLEKIPKSPGCYLYKDTSENIIYVGKAKDLKKRVSSYFQKKDHDAKTESLVANIHSIDFIATNNEVEALILENTLIKKHWPKYNINLKDSKNYAYIQVTDEDFPRLLVSRQKSDKGTLFGPFVSGEERMFVLETLKKAFSFRTCNKMPKKPCLRYHIQLCDAPCVGLISKEDYEKKIESAKLVLKGKTSELLKKMESDMKKYSAAGQFEKALVQRDGIKALLYLEERQNMERQRKFDEDIINYIVRDNKVYLMLFNIYKGTLAGKSEYVFDYIDNFLEDFIVQYYSEKSVENIPKELILPEEIDSTIADFLSEKRKSRVEVTYPKQGEKKQLLELARKNIELAFFGDTQKVEELKEELRMKVSPNVIECFDISHLAGTATVGSMVQFRGGKPDKSNYRRFKIKTVEGIDDFKAIAEVVRRRYTRLKEENREMPNLILIDGGKGQLSAAINELKQLGLQIPIMSIAKRLEEVFLPGLPFPITLNKKGKALNYIREIRDEAHRFAIAYNRLLRKKEMKE
jgi:excinuclease ABC subunit C